MAAIAPGPQQVGQIRPRPREPRALLDSKRRRVATPLTMALPPEEEQQHAVPDNAPIALDRELPRTLALRQMRRAVFRAAMERTGIPLTFTTSMPEGAYGPAPAVHVSVEHLEQLRLRILRLVAEPRQNQQEADRSR
eukprot:TRINITY_DN4663_c0_g3_i1.p1 TRINITY_DN4663_c0_g3~~TRINITY_DN4663_c0_g3_i1.p1  ORF type:complete len:137 (+),score=18.34 TRINITY_DN4663_c0_g3_i1:127-537(+)